MKSETFTPRSSLWGRVSDVRSAPQKDGCIQVTVAGKKLLLRENTDGALEKLGLLRLSRRNEKVFLIVSQSSPSSRPALLAGWRNPPDLLVRRLQPLVVANDDNLYEKIATSYPAPGWKDFDYEGE